MNNSTTTGMNEAFDPREAERLSCIRVGRVPRLKKGDTVWWRYHERWYAVIVERRVPGDVYWARHKSGVFNRLAVVVSASCYGGPV